MNASCVNKSSVHERSPCSVNKEPAETPYAAAASGKRSVSFGCELPKTQTMANGTRTSFTSFPNQSTIHITFLLFGKYLLGQLSTFFAKLFSLASGREALENIPPFARYFLIPFLYLRLGPKSWTFSEHFPFLSISQVLRALPVIMACLVLFHIIIFLSISPCSWSLLLNPSNASLSIHSSYDYIIVGGGLAGLVVANRLTEDANGWLYSQTSVPPSPLLISDLLTT